MSKGQRPYISLQTKFAVLILACTLFTAFIIGGVGLASSVKILDEDSARIMELTVSDAANYLNNAMRNMAECVDEGSLYASTKLLNIDSFKDAYYRADVKSDKVTATAKCIRTNLSDTIVAAIPGDYIGNNRFGNRHVEACVNSEIRCVPVAVEEDALLDALHASIGVSINRYASNHAKQQERKQYFGKSLHWRIRGT